jgi:hypothetical protein
LKKLSTLSRLRERALKKGMLLFLLVLSAFSSGQGDQMGQIFAVLGDFSTLGVFCKLH